MMTQTLLSAPQGRFELRRWPPSARDLLQAWDAADEYLLNFLAEQAPPEQARITLFNDAFGALAVALAGYQVTALSDSCLSQLATRRNLVTNGAPADAVVLLDSLQTPPAGADYALIKIPKTLALLEYQLLHLRPRLSPQTRVIAAGMAKNLAPGAWSLCERILGPVTTSLAIKKARLLHIAYDPAIEPPPNPYPGYYAVDELPAPLLNHANGFSRERLDIGSRFFLRHLPDNPEYAEVADLGCGNGVLGCVYALRQPEANLHFIDESFMAIDAARQNFNRLFPEREARFSVNDCLSGVAANSADCVLCNPPFHQQQAVGGHIAERMFAQAKHVLRKGGELRIIGNRHLDYHKSLKKLFGSCKLIANNDKFVVLQAVKR